ncbi:hypothetical protein L7F22_068691 [Adiantum nelumboides]|nr:hypothetical protein [Adiantum nelumboides]
MAQSSSKKRMPKSVDATCSTPSPWYLDFCLPSGKSDERVHLFFKDKEQSPFKDCGVVKDINKDSSDLDMSPCLGVKVQNGDCYLLEPMAFAWESLKERSDGETMIKVGWIEIKEDTPSENLMDMFTEGFKKVIQYLANLKAQNSKKRKHEGTSQVNQKKALKEREAPSVENSTGMAEQESLSLVPLEAPHRDEASLTETPLITPSIAVIADSASVKVLASIVQPEEKDLDKDVKKTNKSGLDGYIEIEHYFKVGVQFTQLINVDQCNLAPDHFKYRPLSGVYVKFLLRQFAKHSRPVSNAADLMPYDPIKKEPLKANEVHADKLATYHYWILSGQHSIIAAKAFLRNKSTKYASRREFYKYRTARIVVDAPKEVAVRISKMENIETQTTMKTQPYVEAFVIVANITFNHSSFANREAHMVMYPEDIYEQWITILENHQASFARGRQPSITTFRCLHGLEDEDVKLLQQELKEEKICLVKQPHQSNKLDLSARATNIKQTKVFLVEIFKLFKELDPVEASTSWEECRSHYNITDEIYNSLFISCAQWLHLKLQKTKETPAIPEVTKGYVQWIIAQKNGTSRLQFSLPWTIKCVGKNLEGIEFIQGENTSTVRVGVCIIDTTHKSTISSGWSAAQFGKVIDGLCRIAHQPSKFVIVGLVKYQHAASLEKAISEKAKWYELYALPLGSLIAAGTVQPTALCEVTFGVWAFLSQEEQFANHSSLKESLFQPMSTLGIDDEDEFDALTTAKSFFVRRAIKCICLKDDDKVVDIFSLGYGTKEALLQQRTVISVACTNEQMTELEALCHSTIDEDDELKRWASLVSTPQNDNGKDSENEEIDEPLDAEADAILELLQETGQQDIAIEDVSCEVIDTEDVQTIETTEKDPLNPHLNQIVYKDDDKETQASEALQQNFTVNNDSCEVIDTKDAPAVEPIDEESINLHLNQQACKEDDKEIQVSEGQPLQLLETKSSNTMEEDDDASSKTCRRTKEDSTKNILVAQDLSTRVHGCIEVLKSLLSISNVGIWSAANDTQGQSQCQQCVESRITRPNNPGVEAFFKPLAIASAKFGIDLKRLLLIDDAPLKGCINLALNCIFPPSFNIDEEDNILLGELLPYTKALHHVNDICIITGSSLYGQAPIVQGHDLYNHVQKVVIEWEERNLVCLQKTYSTSRLPEAPRVLADENGVSSSTTGMSTRSQDKKRLTLDREKMRILKNIKSISSLKGVELIMLAQKLGNVKLPKHLMPMHETCDEVSCDHEKLDGSFEEEDMELMDLLDHALEGFQVPRDKRSEVHLAAYKFQQEHEHDEEVIMLLDEALEEFVPSREANHVVFLVSNEMIDIIQVNDSLKKIDILEFIVAKFILPTSFAMMRVWDYLLLCYEKFYGNVVYLKYDLLLPYDPRVLHAQVILLDDAIQEDFMSTDSFQDIGDDVDAFDADTYVFNVN